MAAPSNRQLHPLQAPSAPLRPHNASNPPPPPPPQPPPPPLGPVAVSSLSLESYLSLRQALTKGAAAVQGVSPIEEAGMRLPDLRALLLVTRLALLS